MSYTLIAACAQNRTIGKGGSIPWYLPEDFKHFKEVTLGHPVVMGRTTWLSLPEKFRPLPGRDNYVLSRSGGEFSGAQSYTGIQELDAYISSRYPVDTEIFVIGGAQIYQSFLDKRLASKVILSRLTTEYEGDVFFPDFEDDFTLTSTDPREGFVIEQWEKQTLD